MDTLVGGMLLLASSMASVTVLGVCALKGLKVYLAHEASEAAKARELALQKAEVESKASTHKADESLERAVKTLEGRISKMELGRLTRGG